MYKKKQKMVHFRWNFEILQKKIPQGWLNTLEVFLERLLYYVKKISKSGRISIQICTPGVQSLAGKEYRSGGCD